MDNGGVEDAADDVFLTEDAKADAFGVEDWSPDGAAVLRLVSTASVSKLDNDVGLSNQVARSIVAKRNTLPGKKFDDLAQLDAATYVGTTVFNRLLEYVTDKKLFKTAIRIPLVIDDGYGNLKSISSFNDEARAAGKQGFARYTFVDTSSDYGAKADSYDARLQALATAANITIEGELVRYASKLTDYNAGTNKVCYIGDPKKVADVPSSLGDSLMGDMYSQWGWRYKNTKWLYDDADNFGDDGFGTEWDDWSTSSESVLIMSTNTDSGDEPEADIIPPCR